MEWLWIALRQARLVNSANEDLRFSNCQPGENVVIDCDTPRGCHPSEAASAAEEVLPVELEVGFAALGRQVMPRSRADVLVHLHHPGLLDRHSEDEMNRLVRVAEVAAGIPRLVHIGEPQS